MRTVLFAVSLFLSSSGKAQYSLLSGKVISRALLRDQIHEYSLYLKSTECAGMTIIEKKMDLAIDLIDPSGKRLITMDSGEVTRLFINAIHTGNYVIRIYPVYWAWTTDDDETFKAQNPGKNLDSIKVMMGIDKLIEDEKVANQGSYEISDIVVLSRSDCQKKLRAEKIALQRKKIADSISARQVIQWVAKESIPLKSVVAGSGFEDLQSLKSALSNVKYVGLGEATHGTREIFQMKHRMLEFLVKEMGYTTFAMEASYQGCENINNYILNGKGNARSALASQEFYIWDTEEVIDLIEWMHDYNLKVTADKKIRFSGFDIQVFAKSGAIDLITNYLERVDPPAAQLYDSLLHAFYELDSARTLYKNMQTLIGSKPIIERLHAKFANLLANFSMKKGQYVINSSIDEYARVTNCLKNIVQFTDSYSRGYGLNTPRDYYMASNLLEFANGVPDSKIVIWAHNSHISKTDEGFERFGYHLKKAFGEKYFSIGFTINKGSFQAIELKDDGQLGKLTEFFFQPSKEYTLGWHFAQTGRENFLINFRRSDLPVFMSKFTETPIQMWHFGGGVYQSGLVDSYSSISIHREFDAIIFLNNTTRARPTKTGMR